MSWDKSAWRNRSAIMLHELGNVDFQKKVWTQSIDGFSSDYLELYELFEDNAIPEYLDYFIKEGFVSVDVANKLKEIERELFNFEDKVDDPNDNESYWNHPDWKKLSSKARLLFNEEFRDDFIRLGEPYTEWLEKWPI